jgi:hypothetical protein
MVQRVKQKIKKNVISLKELHPEKVSIYVERNKTHCLMNTYHFSAERNYRETLIENLGGAGRVVLTNVIDRGHKNGPERFELTDKGIIIVYNNLTDRKITILFARVGQLYSRFGDKFNTLDPEMQKDIKSKCREWQDLGYNEL